ncbi:MAG: hypothetical protein ACT4RN_09870 [Pseudonocardia sp.]
MTAANPLVVARDHTTATKWSEGAGVVSSWADVVDAHAQDRGAAEIAVNWTAAGLDTLGVAMNPLGELAAAGIGWLIEEIPFLHEPLDALAGDPIQIEDQARTWQRIAAELRQVAVEHVTAVDGLAGWDGAAHDAYRAASLAFAGGFDAGADTAEQAAVDILDSGVLVATVRALIRDTVAGFVGDLIGAAVAAGVAAVFTLGGSVAAFAAWAVRSAVTTAAGIALRISELIGALGARAAKLASRLDGFEDLAQGLARRSEQLFDRGLSFAGRIDGVAGHLPRPESSATRWLDELHRMPPSIAGNKHVGVSNEEILGYADDAATPFVELGKQHESTDRRPPAEQGR